MKITVIVMLLFVSVGLANGEEWKAVVWKYEHFLTETGDWDDMQELEEEDLPTEGGCLSRLQVMSEMMLSIGYKVHSELTNFEAKDGREPFWRLQITDGRNEKRLESYHCTQTILFTLIRSDE